MNIADLLSPEVIANLGAYGIIIVVLLLQQRNHDARWDKVRAEENGRREADRVEHMEKWRMMVSTQTAEMDRILSLHREQYDRTMKGLERQAEVLEMHAHLITVMSQKIDANQFCPIVRKESHG